MKSINLFAIIALELLFASPLPARATSPETAAEENSLMNNAKAFVDAFEKGDSKAVAAFWAEDGDYVDVNGRHLQGRSAIENAFKDTVWIGPTLAPTGYAFAALFYFAFCFGMSRYQAFMERKLGQGRRR